MQFTESHYGAARLLLQQLCNPVNTLDRIAMRPRYKQHDY